MGLFQKGTLLIGPQRAAILSTFEPITSLVIGILVFDEQLSLRSAAGVTRILTAVPLIALSDLHTNQQQA